jgi:hypothetical protein
MGGRGEFLGKLIGMLRWFEEQEAAPPAPPEEEPGSD